MTLFSWNLNQMYLKRKQWLKVRNLIVEFLYVLYNVRYQTQSSQVHAKLHDTISIMITKTIIQVAGKFAPLTTCFAPKIHMQISMDNC